MNDIVTILVALSLSYTLIKVFEKINFPRFLAPILVGIFFGLPQLKTFLFRENTLGLFSTLSNLGLILLLFYVGLEFNFASFQKSRKNTLLIALLSTLLPSIFGFIGLMLIGVPFMPSFLVSVSLSLTSESMALALLEENGITSTKLGQTIIGSGILDDILEIFLVALVSGIAVTSDKTMTDTLLTYLNLAIFTLLFFLLKYFFLDSIHSFLAEGSKYIRFDLFTASIILVLAISVITEYLKLGFAIGAFTAGVLVKFSFEKQNKKLGKVRLDNMIDLNTDLEKMFHNIYIGILLTFLAISGKWLGAIIGNKLSNGEFYQGNLIGWGLNSRGTMELVLAELARTSQLISDDLFSSIVFMSVMSMIIAPLMFNFFFRRHAAAIKSAEESI